MSPLVYRLCQVRREARGVKTGLGLRHCGVKDGLEETKNNS